MLGESRKSKRQTWWDLIEYWEESWRLEGAWCQSDSREIQWTNAGMTQTSRSYNSQQKKKRICRTVDFAVSTDHRVKLKESKKKYKYIALTRELKKLWNMKVTVIPTVIRALVTVTKGLEQGREDLEITGRRETIQTTALLRLARILRRVLET